MLVACLVVEINSALNCCLCRTSMTSHQGQGHRNEHERICHAYVYRHAKFTYHSLTTLRDMATRVQIKNVSRSRRSCDLERRARSSDWEKITYTFSRTNLTANLMGIAWTVSEIIEHLLFSWFRAVWPWIRSGKSNWNVMHSWACLRQSPRPVWWWRLQHTHGQQTMASSISNLFKIVSDFRKQKKGVYIMSV